MTLVVGFFMLPSQPNPSKRDNTLVPASIIRTTQASGLRRRLGFNLLLEASTFLLSTVLCMFS